MEKYLHHHHNQKTENPSFSSTLLDAIYRSIDESNGNSKRQDEFLFYKETMKKKHSFNNHKDDERMSSLKKACMIEKWMEEKVSYEEVSIRKKSMADYDHKKTTNTQPVLLNSSSSSSESSSGGRFSSSESDSVYGLSSRSNSTSYTMQKPKPIRTSLSTRPVDVEFGMYNSNNHYQQQKASKHEGSFVKTKSKALKIYGDLKKVKQPISPGGRLSSFLNSIFTTGNPKKAKISSSSGYEERKLKSEQTSTCSSASSFSRSCLSKTPSSRNGAKRSVRFYPVSVIVDEDSRPCGHKNLYEDKEEKKNATIMAITKSRKPSCNNSNEEELKFHVMNESRRVEHVARDLLRNYQKKKQEEFNNIYNVKIHDREMKDIDDDDDAESYASSDLFELDNLSAIGTIDHRYREELPVYETTHLDTNRAIANGFIL